MADKNVTVATPFGVWIVPRGFGRHIRDVARDYHADMDKHIEILVDLLALVGYAVDVEMLKRLSPRQLVEAEVYAVRVHSRASDNPVQTFPRPDWLREKPWDGPEELGMLTQVVLDEPAQDDECPHSKDGNGHCPHWHDGEACCWCSSPGMSVGQMRAQGME